MVSNYHCIIFSPILTSFSLPFNLLTFFFFLILTHDFYFVSATPVLSTVLTRQEASTQHVWLFRVSPPLLYVQRKQKNIFASRTCCQVDKCNAQQVPTPCKRHPATQHFQPSLLAQCCDKLFGPTQATTALLCITFMTSEHATHRLTDLNAPETQRRKKKLRP